MASPGFIESNRSKSAVLISSKNGAGNESKRWSRSPMLSASLAMPMASRAGSDVITVRYLVSSALVQMRFHSEEASPSILLRTGIVIYAIYAARVALQHLAGENELVELLLWARNA